MFGDENKRKLLDGIVHPAILIKLIGLCVHATFARCIFSYCLTQQAFFVQGIFLWHFVVGTDVVIFDAPLLFEQKTDKVCSTTVCVWCDEKIQRERLMARDKYKFYSFDLHMIMSAASDLVNLP